jgi:hypothetical protein
MNRLGRAVVTDSEMLTIDEIIDRVEAVAPGDIQSLASEFWQPEQMSVAIVGTNQDLMRRGIAKVAPHVADATPIPLVEEVVSQ